MACKPDPLGTSDWRASREDQCKDNRTCDVRLRVCHAVIVRLVGTTRRVDLCRQRTGAGRSSPDTRERCGCCPPSDTKGGVRHCGCWSGGCGRRLRLFSLPVKRTGLRMSARHVFPWRGWPPAPLSVARSVEGARPLCSPWPALFRRTFHIAGNDDLGWVGARTSGLRRRRTMA